MKLGVLSYLYVNLQWCAVVLLSQHKSVDPREKGRDSARKRLEEWTHSFVMRCTWFVFLQPVQCAAKKENVGGLFSYAINCLMQFFRTSVRASLSRLESPVIC